MRVLDKTRLVKKCVQGKVFQHMLHSGADGVGFIQSNSLR